MIATQFWGQFSNDILPWRFPQSRKYFLQKLLFAIYKEAKKINQQKITINCLLWTTIRILLLCPRGVVHVYSPSSRAWMENIEIRNPVHNWFINKKMLCVNFAENHTYATAFLHEILPNLNNVLMMNDLFYYDRIER